ncbi:hypothetical protein [Streptomyces sp. DG1A-41]|uniref:hypothetical protein n=1 Tax=Streptomyces sp. DG1A-41 TaxID=3125779 RepID=UPI0030D19747
MSVLMGILSVGVTSVLVFDDLSEIPGLRHRRRYEAFGSAHGTVWFFSPEMIGSGPRFGLAGSVSTGAAERGDDTGSGSTPRNDARWSATEAADRPRPARICVGSPPNE